MPRASKNNCRVHDPRVNIVGECSCGLSGKILLDENNRPKLFERSRLFQVRLPKQYGKKQGLAWGCWDCGRDNCNQRGRLWNDKSIALRHVDRPTSRIPLNDSRLEAAIVSYETAHDPVTSSETPPPQGEYRPWMSVYKLRATKQRYYGCVPSNHPPSERRKCSRRGYVYANRKSLAKHVTVARSPKNVKRTTRLPVMVLQRLDMTAGRWSVYRPRVKMIHGSTLYYACTECASSFGDPTSCETTKKNHVYDVHRQGSLLLAFFCPFSYRVFYRLGHLVKRRLRGGIRYPHCCHGQTIPARGAFLW
jgi:hypothetical protein